MESPSLSKTLIAVLGYTWTFTLDPIRVRIELPYAFNPSHLIASSYATEEKHTGVIKDQTFSSFATFRGVIVKKRPLRGRKISMTTNDGCIKMRRLDSRI